MIANDYLRKATTFLCVGLMTFVSAGLPGCLPIDGGGGGDGGGGDSSSDVVTLSARQVDPGAIITVSHSSISAGDIVQVNFIATPKTAQVQLIPAESDGQVTLMAPPFLDTNVGVFSAGVFKVSIEGVAQTVDLEVRELPDAPGVAPGDVLRAIYMETQDTLLNLRDELQQARDDFGPKYAEFVTATPAAEMIEYFGAIPDMKALQGRLYVAQRFSKAWEVEDPSSIMNLTHSRPLPVARRPDSTVSMKVVSG